MNQDDSRTFREAYGLLQKHAQALRSQQDPDIDNLTTIVRESLDAYRVCKARIDAVEKALEESLADIARADIVRAGDSEPPSEDAPAAAGERPWARREDALPSAVDDAPTNPPSSGTAAAPGAFESEDDIPF